MPLLRELPVTAALAARARAYAASAPPDAALEDLVEHVWQAWEGAPPHRHEIAAALQAASNGHVADEAYDAPHLESWRPVDLMPVLAGGYDPPVPTVLATKDGRHALFYAHSVNGIHGDSGIGKTWLVIAALADRIRAGRHVIFVDYESHVGEILARLRSIGVTSEQIARHLTYIHPATEAEEIAVSLVLDQVRDDTDLIALDSLGEAFGVDAVDENSDAEVGPWLRRVARRLADAGPALLLTDHSTKAGTRDLHASGSKRKRAAITGASYLVEAKVTPTREQPGTLTITCAKDRHGTYRRDELVATADITPYPDGGVTVHLHRAAPTATDTATEIVARAAVKALRDHGTGATANVLVGLMNVKGAKDKKLAGIAVAVARGAITVTPGPNRSQIHTYNHDLEDEPHDP